MSAPEGTAHTAVAARGSLRVVVVGGEAAGQRVLRAIGGAGHEVVAAFAGSGATGAPVRAEAERLHVRLFPAARVKDPSVVAEIGPVDAVINVHSLYVVAPELLAWPTLGAYNLHPGWLPDFAGRNCPSWAVWLGEGEPGVTVHRMEPEIDRGAIVFRERFPAGPTATGGTVAIECAKRGIDLVTRLVEVLAAGEPELHEQDPSAFRYHGREVPDGGRFRADRTAAELDRLVRACDYGPFASPWGTPVASIGDAEVAIRRVARTHSVADAAPGTLRQVDGRVQVACADEWLEVRSVMVGGAAVDPVAALPIEIALS